MIADLMILHRFCGAKSLNRQYLPACGIIPLIDTPRSSYAFSKISSPVPSKLVLPMVWLFNPGSGSVSLPG
jgi:hypothetical protein